MFFCEKSIDKLFCNTNVTKDTEGVKMGTTITGVEKMKKIFSKRLNKLREGWTLTDIEKVSGISRQIIAKYISGSALPNSETLVTLANVFNVSCDYLLGRNEGTEVDINYIMEETGLSENAINQLKEYTYDEDFHLELFALNQIIEASAYTNFLTAFAKYIFAPKIDEDALDDIYSMILPFFEGVNVPVIGVRNNDGEILYEHISSDDLLYYLLTKEYNELLNHVKNDKKTQGKLLNHLIDLLKPYYEDELYNVYEYSVNHDDYDMKDLNVDKNVLRKVMQKYLNEKQLESERIHKEIISNLSTTD